MKGAHQIDEVDRRILRALQQNAELSHAELAERVGASSASCWRRLRALTAQGVLRSAVRLVDPEAVGRDVHVICQVRLKSQSDETCQAFEQFVASRGEIMECYSMSGEWDYLLRIAVGSIAEYEHLLMRTLLQHAAVATAASHFALRQIKYTTALPV